MDPELQAILNAVLEGQRVLAARLEAMDSKFETKLEAMDSKFETRLQAVDAKLEAMDSKFEAKLEAIATDVATIKEQVRGMNAREQYLMHKTAELEADLFVIKQQLKG